MEFNNSERNNVTVSDLDEKTGRYALEPSWVSLFDSINYAGFDLGSISEIEYN
jgi:hypothetical protein